MNCFARNVVLDLPPDHWLVGLKAGTSVWWNDPQDECTGPATIDTIVDGKVSAPDSLVWITTNEGRIQVFASELVPMRDVHARPMNIACAA